MPVELKNMKVDHSVDARGTACPGPLLAAKKGIAGLNSGEVMEILSADEASNRDIPKWARKKGHEYLGGLEEDGYFRIFLKKK